MNDEIRGLFGTIMTVDSDYGMARIKIGRNVIILPPEAIEVLVDILQALGDNDDIYEVPES